MSSIVIEAVKNFSEVVHEREWERDGKKGISYSQELYVHLGGPFPERIRVTLDEPSKILPLGKYTITPQSLKVGQYGDLEFNRYDLAKTLIPLEGK